MQLLPAEQLCAQIGFFYYGPERPRGILIRQTGTVSENTEMPALLVISTILNLSFRGPLQLFQLAVRHMACVSADSPLFN